MNVENPSKDIAWNEMQDALEALGGSLHSPPTKLVDMTSDQPPYLDELIRALEAARQVVWADVSLVDPTKPLRITYPYEFGVIHDRLGRLADWWEANRDSVAANGLREIAEQMRVKWTEACTTVTEMLPIDDKEPKRVHNDLRYQLLMIGEAIRKPALRLKAWQAAEAKRGQLTSSDVIRKQTKSRKKKANAGGRPRISDSEGRKRWKFIQDWTDKNDCRTLKEYCKDKGIAYKDARNWQSWACKESRSNGSR